MWFKKLKKTYHVNALSLHCPGPFVAVAVVSQNKPVEEA
jgi:TusA-related sulfurtransferase